MTDAELIVQVVRSAMFRNVPLAVEVDATIASLQEGLRYLGTRTNRTQTAYEATVRQMKRKQDTLASVERLRARFASWRG